MKIFVALALMFVLSTNLFAQPGLCPETCECYPECDPQCLAETNNCTTPRVPITGGMLLMLFAAGTGLGIIKKMKE